MPGAGGGTPVSVWFRGGDLNGFRDIRSLLK